MSLNDIISQTTISLATVKSLINIEYAKSWSALLKLAEIVIGFICFMVIYYSCYNSYDPYDGRYVGFIGGKSETSFLLIVFACFLCATLLYLCYLGSVTTTSVIPRTTFELVFYLIAFLLHLIFSLILMIEVIVRNKSNINGYNEPGYGGKITASVFGLINSFIYLANVWFAFKIYKHI